MSYYLQNTDLEHLQESVTKMPTVSDTPIHGFEAFYLNFYELLYLKVRNRHRREAHSQLKARQNFLMKKVESMTLKFLVV